MTIRLFAVLSVFLVVPILATSCKSDVLKLEEMVDEQCMCRSYECFQAMREKINAKFSDDDYKKMTKERPDEMKKIVVQTERCTERLIGNPKNKPNVL